MAKKAAHTSDLKEDLTFQRREWRMQHVGWWALTAFVLGATLGLFGKGPLSHAVAGSHEGPLWLEYDRFVRVGTVSRIAIHGTAPSPALDLRLSREFLDANRIERITPPPASVEIGPSETRLRFSREAAGPFTILLDVQPLRGWRNRAWVAAAGGAPLRFTQFAYF